MSKLKLGVEVLGAHKLQPKDDLSSSGSFVELNFLSETFSTSVRGKDPNPVWNERFFFSIPDISLLPHQTLEACVYTVSSANKSSSQRSLLGRIRLAGTSFAYFSDAEVSRFPLEKRSILSPVRGELSLKVYLTEDFPPFHHPPPSPVHVFSAQASPATSPTLKKSPEKKSKTKHVFQNLPKQTHGTHEKKSETRPAMIFSSPRSDSSPAKPFSPPPWTDGKHRGTYNLVEPMPYLFVRVVKARNLAVEEMSGNVDPFVEVKLGNYTAQTTSYENNENPEWNQVFAFSGDRIQSSELVVRVKDKSLMVDEFLGRLQIDLREVPDRAPPDSPLAPEWYRLENKNRVKLRSELMLAVWRGTQADEAFPDAILSDSVASDSLSSHHLRAKVYHAPRLWYLRLEIIEVQDVANGDKHKHGAEVMIQASLGRHREHTGFVQTNNNAATWKKKFVFIAAEPFDEDLELSLEKKEEKNTETIGILKLRVSELEKRWDEKSVLSRWYVVEKPSPLDLDLMKKHKFSTRLHLIAYLDGGYHVFDGPTQYASDLRPTARELSKKPVGVLELGILGAEGLSPMKSRDGKGSADVYCVAKYGQKWVRTRTAVDNLRPKFNEQYTWEVYDPATVLTIAVFHNNLGTSADKPMGKIRIRLSTLETGRKYKLSFPLAVLDSAAVKKNGEFQVAVRFSSLGFINVMWKYAEPVYPKQHYKRPIPVLQQEHLRRRAKEIVVERLGRSEPPLKKEVIEYINETGSKLWSMRKGNVHFNRLIALLSGPNAALGWLGTVCEWKNTWTTVLVHMVFIMLVMFPELILPTIFLYMFVVGLWNYFCRAPQISGIDLKLSMAENANPDELDEELDSFPSSRGTEIIRYRYDRLRNIAGRVQTTAGDIATQGERIQALLSWRDPRATFIFWICCLGLAFVVYVIPFKLVALFSGLFAMRHPKLRSKSPSVVSNFFKRLPARMDDLL